MTGSLEIVTDIFQALSRPFQGPFPKLLRPQFIFKKHSNVTYVYTMPRDVKFFKQDTLIQSVLCVENVL